MFATRPRRSSARASAGDTLLSMSTLSSAAPATRSTSAAVLQAVARFEQTLGRGGLLSKATVGRAVSLMHELSSPGEHAGWPSFAQLRALPLLWPEAERARLQGTHAGEL